MVVRSAAVIFVVACAISAVSGRHVLQLNNCPPPSGNLTCPACGVAFGTCCPDGTCTVGTTCMRDPLDGSRMMCSPCGNVNEDCCSGSTCNDPRFPSICNRIGKCEACGDAYLQCCQTKSLQGVVQYSCSNNATTCMPMNGQFTCVPRTTEPLARRCSSDTDCVSNGNDSYICQDGGCQPCGTIPRRCCRGSTCRGSLLCQDGFCHPTGSLYNYCAKDDPRCKTQVWGALTCDTSISRCVPTDLCPAAYALRPGSSGLGSSSIDTSRPTLPPLTNTTTNTTTCGKVFGACCSTGNCTDPATKCNGNFLMPGASVCSPCGQLGEDCCTSGEACRERQASTFCNSIGKCEACGNWFLKCCPDQKCGTGLSCSGAGLCMPTTNSSPPRGEAIPQQCTAAGTCSNGLVCRDGFCHVCGDFYNYCCAGSSCNRQPWGNLTCAGDRCIA